MKSEQNRRVTLQDIAKETGYSINTVSHALRGMKDISPQTRKAIQETADALGYIGNQIASSLQSGRTKTLAVILGSMANPFYGIMTDALQHAASKAGYSLITMCSRDEPDLEYEQAEVAVRRLVDGILLFPSDHCEKTVERLKAVHMPFVLMSRTYDGAEADSVVSDDEEAAYVAVSHLIAAGRRKVAYISSRGVIYSGPRRLKGFYRACDDAGIPECDRYVYNDIWYIAEFEEREKWRGSLSQKLIELKEKGFNGLFVFCDMEAWHVMGALRDSGVIAQDDFGVVSVDNIEDAFSYPVSLCSVDCSIDEMVSEGVRLLIERIHGDTSAPKKIVCPVKLVCRGSCGYKETKK